ncbi:hypothetical protein R3P38DRAFT_2763105 [Favolaschia claudopus]|uniref:Uncharacterized protein n=1 Tax=Favolaschia claudopus TaxID=2862362 RepID=A0AAW0DNP6_9AGAR
MPSGCFVLPCGAAFLALVYAVDARPGLDSTSIEQSCGPNLQGFLASLPHNSTTSRLVTIRLATLPTSESSHLVDGRAASNSSAHSGPTGSMSINLVSTSTAGACLTSSMLSALVRGTTSRARSTNDIDDLVFLRVRRWRGENTDDPSYSVTGPELSHRSSEFQVSAASFGEVVLLAFEHPDGLGNAALRWDIEIRIYEWNLPTDGGEDGQVDCLDLGARWAHGVKVLGPHARDEAVRRGGAVAADGMFDGRAPSAFANGEMMRTVLEATRLKNTPAASALTRRYLERALKPGRRGVCVVICGR